MMTEPRAAGRSKATALLRDPAYAHYWLSQIISQVGTWMQTASQAWLVLTLTGSAQSLGIVVACQYLPALALSLPAGVLADQCSKRRLLLVTQVGMTFLAAVMAVIVHEGLAQYHHILGFALLYGAVNAMGQPARQAFAVELAGSENVSAAASLNSLSFNVARLLGPAVSGLIIMRWGVAWAFAANALSFLPMVWFLSFASIHVSAGNHLAKSIADPREGLAYVWSTPLVRNVMLLMTWMGAFGLSMHTLVPAYARLVLGLNAEGYGFLVASVGVGAVCGALWQGLTGGASQQRIVGGATVLAVVYALLSLPLTAAGCAVLMMLAGFAMVTVLINANTMVQTVTPSRLRGRVTSIYVLVILGMNPLGAYITGFAFDLLGGRLATGVLGVAILGGVAVFASIQSRPRVAQVTATVALAA
ncbi:MAG: MFS transporter [Candidatus Binatia bacterium]